MQFLAPRAAGSPRTYFLDFDFGFERFFLEAGLAFFAAGFFAVFFRAAGACFAFAPAWEATACCLGGRVSARACGMATGLHNRFMLVAARPQFLQK